MVPEILVPDILVTEVLALRRIGETLHAHVEGGALVELHLRRDHDPLPFGHVTDAIVREQVGARLRVDCNGVEAWLIGSPHHPLGTRRAVRVVRAPTPEPGQIKRAHVVEHSGLAEAAAAPTFASDFPDSFEIEDWCDRAISGHVPFTGGSLSLERTRAGLVIDVDGRGPALDINLSAARKIAQALRLFQVGGMVMVDFITAENRRDRLELDAALDAALKKDPRAFERTAINGFGMVQIVRAKRGASLIDQLCGVRRHAPSLETQTLMLLDEAARSVGAGLRTLVARREILATLEKWPSLLEELRAKLGANVKMAADDTIRGHGHVHVQPV
jgi:ribonuclease G